MNFSSLLTVQRKTLQRRNDCYAFLLRFSDKVDQGEHVSVHWLWHYTSKNHSPVKYVARQQKQKIPIVKLGSAWESSLLDFTRFLCFRKYNVDRAKSF